MIYLLLYSCVSYFDDVSLDLTDLGDKVNQEPELQMQAEVVHWNVTQFLLADIDQLEAGQYDIIHAGGPFGICYLNNDKMLASADSRKAVG